MLNFISFNFFNHSFFSEKILFLFLHLQILRLHHFFSIHHRCGKYFALRVVNWMFIVIIVVNIQWTFRYTCFFSKVSVHRQHRLLTKRRSPSNHFCYCLSILYPFQKMNVILFFPLLIYRKHFHSFSFSKNCLTKNSKLVRSALVGDITLVECFWKSYYKTGETLLVGKHIECRRRKSMIAYANTKAIEI